MIKIIEATHNDLDVIFDIDNDYEFDKYSRKIIEEMLVENNYLNLIAYKENIPCGYISINYVLDEASLLKIVVKKDFRKCGIGSLLIEKMIDILKEKLIKSIYLEVRSNNISAKNLYEKNSFEKIYEREKYYGDGVNADIYRLNLL